MNSAQNSKPKESKIKLLYCKERKRKVSEWVISMPELKEGNLSGRQKSL